MDSGGGATFTVIERFFIAIPIMESITITVKLKVPAVVAEPEILPLAGFRVSPAGNAPAVIAHV